MLLYAIIIYYIIIYYIIKYHYILSYQIVLWYQHNITNSVTLSGVGNRSDYELTKDTP